ncbi:MAG: hypothetical protein PHZ26_01385 [Candidatus Gracilibacteria bacterium]|nr:hypothetical protein [Candidatus Gracilibacteria bacterium]MDD2908387.1 hypothetical protein [Candidatus Gracilibacteria bacterium]
MFGKKNKLEKQQELKMDFLINSGYKQLELHNKIFDEIDKKVMWFLTFISAIEGYLLSNYFINKNLNIFFTKNFIFLVILIVGLFILGIQIFILKGKKFSTGPNIYKQTIEFWLDGKTFYSLKDDTLRTLNQSYNENDKIISYKAKCFRISINLLILYFILIFFYFLIPIIMSDEKNDNLPLTSNNTGSQQYNEPPLKSENTGKIEKTFTPKK